MHYPCAILVLVCFAASPLAAQERSLEQTHRLSIKDFPPEKLNSAIPLDIPPDVQASFETFSKAHEEELKRSANVQAYELLQQQPQQGANAALLNLAWAYMQNISAHGQYVWKGDLNGDGVQDLHDLILRRLRDSSRGFTQAVAALGTLQRGSNVFTRTVAELNEAAQQLNEDKTSSQISFDSLRDVIKELINLAVDPTTDPQTAQFVSNALYHLFLHQHLQSLVAPILINGQASHGAAKLLGLHYNRLRQLSQAWFVLDPDPGFTQIHYRDLPTPTTAPQGSMLVAALLQPLNAFDAFKRQLVFEPYSTTIDTTDTLPTWWRTTSRQNVLMPTLHGMQQFWRLKLPDYENLVQRWRDDVAAFTATGRTKTSLEWIFFGAGQPNVLFVFDESESPDNSADSLTEEALLQALYEMHSWSRTFKPAQLVLNPVQMANASTYDGFQARQQQRTRTVLSEEEVITLPVVPELNSAVFAAHLEMQEAANFIARVDAENSGAPLYNWCELWVKESPQLESHFNPFRAAFMRANDAIEQEAKDAFKIESDAIEARFDLADANDTTTLDQIDADRTALNAKIKARRTELGWIEVSDAIELYRQEWHAEPRFYNLRLRWCDRFFHQSSEVEALLTAARRLHTMEQNGVGDPVLSRLELYPDGEIDRYDQIAYQHLIPTVGRP